MKTSHLSIESFRGYASRMQEVLSRSDWDGVAQLGQAMRECWITGHQVFFCGNGGSAGNAIHLANDYLYGIAKRTGGGMRVSSLSANAAVITCLANDVGYDSIYSEQLAVQAQPGDLLIVLSGSGNSPNILKVLEQAKVMGVTSCAILGYTGGKAKALADIPIHFDVNDMQIAEDMQLVVGHMLMQWLYENQPVAK
ncbi:D-sedoheptulose 7-phosphate isomerase [Herbaspirillum sp. Sphag1AN]|uniref:SIS domain-containing protein n=1 Tax=unclassified Herbaspirillum TaxID=2624150 RepID=UPI00160F4EA1|nr:MULTISPECIES: SIS domain-containing protein [unclassified Herbaspirillum]MBB3213003.1 D-sedoheptulose 7-phosphate isomerase [Herbaspirillum sp. Sphag1AN]MBB3246200.1 D-sedoheptulose 7-phosphate isomerase [Herbaspirillum sp. Sphag64]